MPYGRYPDRVGPFKKWSNDRINKADINDRATGSRKRSSRAKRLKRKKRKQD